MFDFGHFNKRKLRSCFEILIARVYIGLHQLTPVNNG